jgi:DNA-binding transcriptional ArsR family regulator
MKFETPCACTTLRRAARAVTAAYDTALAPSGLRITKFSILRKLARIGPLPVTRLAAEAALDRSTMGRNLNPLERRGLVRIEVGNRPARARRLSHGRGRGRDRGGPAVLAQGPGPDRGLGAAFRHRRARPSARRRGAA